VTVVAAPRFPPYGLPSVYDRALSSERLFQWCQSASAATGAFSRPETEAFSRAFVATSDAEGWASFERLPMGRYEAEYDREMQTSDSTVYDFVAVGQGSSRARWNAASGTSTVTL